MNDNYRSRSASPQRFRTPSPERRPQTQLSERELRLFNALSKTIKDGKLAQLLWGIENEKHNFDSNQPLDELLARTNDVDTDSSTSDEDNTKVWDDKLSNRVNTVVEHRPPTVQEVKDMIASILLQTKIPSPKMNSDANLVTSLPSPSQAVKDILVFGSPKTKFEQPVNVPKRFSYILRSVQGLKGFRDESILKSYDKIKERGMRLSIDDEGKKTVILLISLHFALILTIFFFK